MRGGGGREAEGCCVAHIQRVDVPPGGLLLVLLRCSSFAMQDGGHQRPGGGWCPASCRLSCARIHEHACMRACMCLCLCRLLHVCCKTHTRSAVPVSCAHAHALMSALAP